ncbi:uncharacterized protein LOC110840475 isoform X2 [Zootermopsis nevadensis]|uniref:uncharacterized protein LOC110840475 isoform X2 n=1 Tax=Zootermopsis nevadensis TaxID=136037 RepID=UPI000B8E914B|nr:uncharacterized protein LOC110840475 isoform X2 [Zootermopsis nevadensis]
MRFPHRMKGDWNENERRNFEKLFRFYILWFRLICVPIKSHKPSHIYTLYSVLLTLNTYTAIAAIMADVFQHADDLERVMENFRVIFPSLSIMWVQLSMRFQKKSMERLMYLAAAFKWEDAQAKKPADDSFKMTAILPVIKPATLRISIFFVTFHTCHVILRLALGEGRPLSINAYYGVNVSSSPLYEMVNVSQFFMAANCFPLFFGYTGLYAFLLTIACSQLEKLRASILNIRQRNDTSEEDSDAENGKVKEGGKVQTSQQVFSHMQQQLNDCVRHHQDILRFMNALEEAISPVLMGQFIIILTGMCFAAFSFAMAESVRDAAYGCDWVGTPVSFPKCLVFIIAAASKEFTLTAGKFVPVTRSTMLNVINQTFSYLMFLMQVKEKNKHV